MARRKARHRVQLGNAVREMRNERGWSQEALAARAGIHWTYLGGVERGERNPTWDVLVRLAGGLGTTVAELAERAGQ